MKQSVLAITTSVIMLFSFRLDAQIQFWNSSFEGSLHSSICNTTPLFWSTCPFLSGSYGGVGILPYGTYPILQTDSLSYISIVRTGLLTLNINGNWVPLVDNYMQLHQKLDCPLYQYKFHSFDADIVSGFTGDWVQDTFVRNGMHTLANLIVEAGMDSCANDTVLFTSFTVDTLWQRCTITFVPHYSYPYISIIPKRQDSTISWLGVDHLSFIFVWDTTSVHANIESTEIAVGDSVELHASAIIGYDKAWWTEASTGDTIAIGLGPIKVSPSQTTKYVACIEVCDSCCWFSFDTVTVYVHGVGIDPVGKKPYSIPTFITQQNQVWKINDLPMQSAVILYDELGREIYKNKNYNNSFSFALLPVGMYFYQLQIGDEVMKGKVVWLR